MAGVLPHRPLFLFGPAELPQPQRSSGGHATWSSRELLQKGVCETGGEVEGGAREGEGKRREVEGGEGR